MAVETYARGDDRVQIRLGNDTVRACTMYDVRTGVFNQPSTFSTSLGDGTSVANLIKRVPPNTAFQILVGSAPQFSGFTEGRASEGGPNAGSELRIHGRSILAKLLTDIEKEQSFNAATHLQLVQKALADYEVFKPFRPGVHPDVLTSNAAIRKTRSKSNVSSSGKDDWIDVVSQTAGNQGDAYPVLRAKLAEKVLDLLRRHLETVGMFLWDSPTGDIVVGRPNATQPPIARLVRRITDRAQSSSIVSHAWNEDWSHRYSRVDIFGKTTGRKYTRHTTSGDFTDQEVIDLGFRRVKVLRDVHVTSPAHAVAIAKKHLAAGRREALHLEYTVRGHSMTNIITGGTAIWAPDTVVDIEDDVLGLSGNYYIESVRFRRDRQGTRTVLRLMEPDALIFGSDDSFATPANGASASSAAATPKAKTFNVLADMTLLDLSLALYGDTKHTQAIYDMNASVLQWNRFSEQFIAPADSVITYIPAS